ncbi:MAG: hypothetical protein K6T71_04300 [Candidatus Bipolaricaulota bacterium]|nr:hypothetical protein [Candidatus Bipolaricaulota bacterium]
MKLKLDENLDARLAPLLQQAGHAQGTPGLVVMRTSLAELDLPKTLL